MTGSNRSSWICRRTRASLPAIFVENVLRKILRPFSSKTANYFDYKPNRGLVIRTRRTAREKFATYAGLGVAVKGTLHEAIRYDDVKYCEEDTLPKMICPTWDVPEYNETWPLGSNTIITFTFCEQTKFMKPRFMKFSEWDLRAITGE